MPSSLPSSSRMLISVDGIGKPIEPLKSSPGRLMHAAGEVSVSPQACVRILPVTSFQRLATASCTAMPPPSVRRSLLKSTLSKPGVCSSALNSVFTPLMYVNLYLLQLGDEGGEIARIGDEHVAPAEHDEQQAVRGEREDVIQRQRGDQRRGIARERRAYPLERLQHVRDHVAVREHGALGDAGGAAGVLQERDVRMRERDGLHAHACEPAFSASLEALGAGQVEWLHLLALVAHDEVDDVALRETRASRRRW